MIVRASISGVQYDCVGGGVGTSQAENLAVLFSGMDDTVYQFAMAKWAGDTGSEEKTKQAFRLMAVALAKALGWRCNKSQTLYNASDLAIALHIHNSRHMICKSCKGTGLLKRGAAPCKACNSSGTKYRPDTENAILLGVSDTAYRKTWRHRVDVLYAEASTLEGQVHKHFRRAIA